MLTFLIILLYIGVVTPLIIGAVKALYYFQDDDEDKLGAIKWRNPIIIAVSGISLFTILLTISGYYNEILWFKELGYSSVFWTEFNTKIIAHFIGFIVIFSILSLTTLKARRIAPKIPKGPTDEEIERSTERKYRGYSYTERDYNSGYVKTKRATKTVNIITWISIFVFSLNFAYLISNAWREILQYFSQVPSGKVDPIFGNDISFYLFSLPLYRDLLGTLFIIFLFANIVTYPLHHFFYKRSEKFYGYDADEKREEIQKEHLARIIKSYFVPICELLLFFCAWSYLAKFNLLYSSGDVLYGIGYSDVNATIPGLNIFITVLLLAIIPIGISLRKQNLKLGTWTAVVIFGSWIGFVFVWPALNQSLTVKPSQLDKENSYIKYHIAATREAYGLTKITEKQFPAIDDLSFTDIQNDEETIGNIRLWDWHALQQALRQKQEIRQYYKFTDIDVDRYIINGKYRQVMLSAREISTEDLPSNSKNWVNLHLKYTHGYGVCLNLVNEFTQEGWPNLILKNIPTVSSAPELNIKRPEIYYGENVGEDVFVKTSTQEFDYPQGDKNAYCTYKGKGGVEIGSGLRKFSLALKFNGFTMLLSEYLKPDSRIMFNRNIEDRVKKIAPFIKYDEDPYLVISDNGRLYWIIDGYTKSDNYPYSEPSGKGYNYIRNSVKVTVDAYDGTTLFYVADPSDVIIRTWENIFPILFKPLAKMPTDLQRHLRYPEDLLNVQGEIYGNYHMTDPNVFFNKEDAWIKAQEKINDSLQPIQPYWGMVKLPGEKKAEFLEMLPFTPRTKQNLVGWIASRSDKGHYGELLVYKFPKDKQVPGTSQIEAKIDQNPEMSSKLTLWKQKGSEVIRGNMLAIPIKNSLLYVEPIYIQATGLSMPELVKVAVAYGEKLVWADSFDEALKEIFNVSESEPMSAPSIINNSSSTEKTKKVLTKDEVFKQASTYYNQYLKLMGEGKAQEAGKVFEALGKTLNQK